MHADKQRVGTLQAMTHQGHQHKHKSFNPFTALGCEFWVFRIRVSRHRLDLSPCLPSMTFGSLICRFGVRRYRLFWRGRWHVN